MIRGILGKKLGMTGIFTPEGDYIPVTVVEAGPCVITQIKTEKTDGYNACQLGFVEKKPSRTNRPLLGHFAKSKKGPFAYLREFRAEDPAKYKLGESIKADLFDIGERVDVTGYSKGRGFSGVIKRHGFHRGPMTHGSKNVRPPGSIGCSAWPSRVVKGKKLPGRYGNSRNTIKNLEIVDIRPDQNLILIKGAVPGHRNAVIEIKKRKVGK